MATFTNTQSLLESLLDDILLMIFECIASERDGSTEIRKHPSTKTLLNIALCSRRINSLVQPALYRNIEDPFRCSRLQLWLRLLEVPLLASYVKVLHTNASGYRRGFGHFVPSFTEENWNHLKAEVTNTATSSEDALAWYSAVKKGEWNAWVALVLSRLSNLEQLTIFQWQGHKNIAGDHTYPWLAKFLATVAVLQDKEAGHPRALPTLRTVRIRSKAEDYIFVLRRRSCNFSKSSLSKPSMYHV